jgi:hypothetical protein
MSDCSQLFFLCFLSLGLRVISLESCDVLLKCTSFGDQYDFQFGIGKCCSQSRSNDLFTLHSKWAGRTKIRHNRHGEYSIKL